MHRGLRSLALLPLLAPAALLAAPRLLPVPEGAQRPAEGYYSQPRVEFAFEDRATVSLVGRDFRSSLKWDYADVEALIHEAGALELGRMFASTTPEQLDALRKSGEARRPGLRLPDLNNWYTVVLPSEQAAEELAAKLAKNPRVRSASVAPLPVMQAADIAPTTPDYSASQDYQDAAPYGVGIAAGWAQPGGQGQNVSILHCEGGWVVDHEDYDLTYTGGGNTSDSGWWNHGTACVSILGAPDNGYGVSGMAPAAAGLYSRGIFDFGGPDAWIASMAYLDAGDVISASWGYGGTPAPGQTCVCNCSQFGGVPAESNQADFDAIQTVTASGILVVTSASNGSMPLDDPYYAGAYDLGVRDSGALLIGAIDPGGVPTCWTNHGSRVDAHAWGSSVTSGGYGALFDGGGDTRQYYTSGFGGTSAACPIVSGAIASLQSLYKQASGGATIDPWQMRALLRGTGTPQTGDFAKLIGNQPDLVQLIEAALSGLVDVTPPTIVHAPVGNTPSNDPVPVQATVTDDTGVVEVAVHHSVDGGATWNSFLLAPQGGDLWSGAFPGQPAGTAVQYYVWARDDATPPNEAVTPVHVYTILTEGQGIVIWSPSASASSSGAEWESALSAAGYPHPVMNVDDLNGVALTGSTDALVVLLGVYDNNFVVPAGGTEGPAIADYVAAGGKVYLEGGDCWAYDPTWAGGYDFSALFGLNGVDDGTGDLATAVGHGPLGGSWAYVGENNWIDRLSSAGASQLFSNDAVGYDCGYYQTGAATTAGVSFELAGLVGFDGVVETLFGPALFDVLPGILAAAPASLGATAMEGTTTGATLTLSNVGHRGLGWTARAAAGGAPLAAERTVHEPLELAKGDKDPRPGSAITAIGGPDGFGNAWIDSDQPGGPAVDFQDISATGAALAMGDDDLQGPFALGFPFAYYGNVFYEVHVCSNGFLSFTSNGAPFVNDPIVTAGGIDAFVAPFWDDLAPHAGGTVHYQAFPDRFVVQWTNVPHYPNTGAYTFQAILHADHAIEFQYQALSDATSATVGIENIFDAGGLQVAYNAPYLHDEMAVRLAPFTGVGQLFGWLEPGESFALPVGFDARPLTAGVYYSTVLLNSTEFPDYQNVPATFTVTPGPRQPAPIDGIQWTWTDTDGTDYALGFHLSFPPVTQDVDGDPLVVDHYDYYWAFEAYGDFPSAWSHWASTVAPGLDVVWGIDEVFTNGFVIITAVDEDGVVVASSRPELTGGGRLPATVQSSATTAGPVVR